MKSDAQPLRIETTRSGRAQSVVQEARPRSGVVVSYGKCFGREGLKGAGERGARLLQTRFIGDRQSRRGCHSSRERCKEGLNRAIADDGRYESYRRAIFTRRRVIVFTAEPVKPAA